MWRWIALFAVPLLLYGAGDSALDRATLHGLDAVNVVVDPPDAFLDRLGLRQDMLHELVVDRLRAAGIRIDPAALEFVALRISAAPAERKLPAGLNLNLAVYQPVTLARDPSVRTATKTWEVETTLVAPVKLLLRATTAGANQLADRLAAAWRSVNPR